MLLEEAEKGDAPAQTEKPIETAAVQPAASPSETSAAVPAPQRDSTGAVTDAGFGKAHASPSVRAFARNLAIDLSRFAGRKIVLEIHNHPNDWSGEDTYFSRIELVSE